MIDFSKVLNEEIKDKEINPIVLYDTLDRKSITGPLRPAQSYILQEWFNNRQNDKDVVIKLHTGEGKTLIGLLLLQSKLNSDNGPCLYICPNKYLVKQVCEEAYKFGIQYCTFDDSTEIPEDYISSKKILITHAHKVFNGKSKFGIDNNYIEAGSVVLDDAHACSEIIMECQTISIKKSKEENLYNKLLMLFSEELQKQGEGSYIEIINGNIDTLMHIPYWSWNDKKSEVLAILAEYSNSCDSSVFFVWPMLKNKIQDYRCFITGDRIEIVPYNVNVKMFGTFSKAGFRFLMSATTQEDSFFIKGLMISINAIANPLRYTTKKWSGEKMIIIPSLIDELCNRTTVVSHYAPIKSSIFGMAALVPNTNIANHYTSLGAIATNETNVFSIIDGLKNRTISDFVVINNRYDGIDLPDEACRILVIDSLPYFRNLCDLYEQNCRSSSNIINKKIAQKIEQGLGRGVRGEKDYCAIIITGSDLDRFVAGSKTNKYFSPQTRKQIEIGQTIAKLAQEDKQPGSPTMKPIIDAINQMLSRENSWKQYYTKQMNAIVDDDSEIKFYDRLSIEVTIENHYSTHEYELASEKMQEYIDNYIDPNDLEERGWYLQQLARYLYEVDKEKSIKIQQSAHKNNVQLLLPKIELKYTKKVYINGTRMQRIRTFISNYNSYTDLLLDVSNMCDLLSFGVNADRFEGALQMLGSLLGFESDRPDKEIGKGPDNLWCGENNEYCIFECKNGVKEKDECEISKKQSGQMNNHCAWYDNIYGKDSIVNRFMIFPSKRLSYEANFTHEVRIIRQNKLKYLKENLLSFIKELENQNLNDLSVESLQKWINSHKLNIIDFKEEYSEAAQNNHI